MIVVDASIALAWSHKDEVTAEIDAVLRRAALDGAIVPPIWPLEIINGLEMAVRRKRIVSAVRDQLLLSLRGLGIEVEASDADRVWTRIASLSSRRRLTAYDASYLELAVRRQLPLATNDKELIAAAKAEGIEVLP